MDQRRNISSVSALSILSISLNTLSISATVMIPDVAPTDIDRVFDYFGPTPRLCIDFLSDQERLTEHKDDVQSTISRLTAIGIEQMLNEASGLTLDSFSHKICLVRRKTIQKAHSGTVIVPITPFIKSRLASQFRKSDRADQIHLYKYFARVANTRQAAGFLFEALAQQVLEQGRDLELLPMVHLDKEEEGSTSLPQWHSSHSALPNTTLEDLRRKTLKKRLHVRIQPSCTFEYPCTGPSSIKPNVSYVPEISNEAAMDSFIVLDSFLYIFQFTIAAKHDIKPGLINFFEKCRDVPCREAWRFVFVIPPDQVLTCPQPRSLKLRELLPYTTIIDLSMEDDFGSFGNIFTQT